LQKLGILYTDKAPDPDKAIDTWRKLLELDPSNRRAQDTLKKVYVAGERWDELEEYYRETGRMDEYVRVLERQLESADDKASLAMKIAVLYRDEIQKDDRAARAFEKVLTYDEYNLEAAEALIPLYEQGRDPRKLVRALDIQLGATEDVDLKLERIRRLADYSESKLRDKEAAMGRWLDAVAIEPGDESMRSNAERLAEACDGWPTLVDGYQKIVNDASDRHETLPLLKVVARVQEEQLSDVDAALPRI
jgi:tetratricopeptide (TPR) repeat protein